MGWLGNKEGNINWDASPFLSPIRPYWFTMANFAKSKITKLISFFFISIDQPIIPYLPIKGTTSDVSGIWVEANKQNTVSDNRIVTPITISSPLSGSSVNKINVVNDVTIPANQGTTSDVSGMWVEANK